MWFANLSSTFRAPHWRSCCCGKAVVCLRSPAAGRTSRGHLLELAANGVAAAGGGADDVEQTPDL